MTTSDIRSLAGQLIDRIKRLPLLALIGAAAGVVALGIVAIAGSSGPTYTPLFDGLSPSQGGLVIAALQKDGIPYQLNNGGNIIEVPAADVGRARLELGASGTPGGSSSSALKSLEHSSMTTSQVATRTLRDQAIESSLRRSIAVFSGARKVQVLLARPRSTPFLSDQPKPKASIVLTGASQADSALGQSVAQIVAGAVPGLKTMNVVVATNHGRVLYPVSRDQNISQEMGIQRRIEASQEAKIREMLVPILGSGNFRVSVSANVKFAKKTTKTIAYGPKFYPVTSSTESKQTFGIQKSATGIPGALSNQPPGASAAPLNPPATTTKKPKPKPIPEHVSKKDNKTYALDETDTVDHPAGWSIHNIAVSVVVNQSAIGKLKPSAIKKMVVATIAQKSSTVRVTSAAFVAPGQAILPPPRPNIALIIQAVLLLIGSFGILFGVALPSVKWLRSLTRQNIAGPKPIIIPLDDEDQQQASNEGLHQVTARVNEIGRTDPAALAGILEQWTRSQ
jgi:flagellar M-ring protein FliF